MELLQYAKNMLFTLKVNNRLIVMRLMRSVLQRFKLSVTITRLNFCHVRYLLRFLLQHSITEKSDNSLSGWRNPNEMQQYADIYLLLNYSTSFGRPSRPSSGVHKTVVAASGTDHTIWGTSFFKCDLWSRLKKLAPQIVWSVPEAATTVLCTPDDGRDGRPRLVE